MLFTNEDLEKLRQEAKDKYGECILSLKIYEDNFLAKIHCIKPEHTVELAPNSLELI